MDASKKISELKERAKELAKKTAPYVLAGAALLGGKTADAANVVKDDAAKANTEMAKENAVTIKLPDQRQASADGADWVHYSEVVISDGDYLDHEYNWDENYQLENITKMMEVTPNKSANEIRKVAAMAQYSVYLESVGQRPHDVVNIKNHIKESYPNLAINPRTGTLTDKASVTKEDMEYVAVKTGRADDYISVRYGEDGKISNYYSNLASFSDKNNETSNSVESCVNKYYKTADGKEASDELKAALKQEGLVNAIIIEKGGFDFKDSKSDAYAQIVKSLKKIGMTVGVSKIDGQLHAIDEDHNIGEKGFGSTYAIEGSEKFAEYLKEGKKNAQGKGNIDFGTALNALNAKSK